MRHIFILVFSIQILTEHSILLAQIFSVDETHIYSVHWYSIPLGHVEFTVLDSSRSNEGKVYKIRSIFRSDPRIGIISVSDSLYSDIDERFFTRNFLIRGWNIDDGNAAEYEIDYESHTYRYSKWHLNDDVDTSTTQIGFNSPLLQDGVSSIYYVRNLAGRDSTIEFPTLISGEVKWTKITSFSKAEIIRLPKSKKEVEVFRVDGQAKYKGFRGFSGKWTAWFSADSRRIPVYAELAVFIGNVKIELKSEHF